MSEREFLVHQCVWRKRVVLARKPYNLPSFT